MGARVHDAETGLEHDVPARVVVNATGVWSGRVETLAGVDARSGCVRARACT